MYNIKLLVALTSHLDIKFTFPNNRPCCSSKRWWWSYECLHKQPNDTEGIPTCLTGHLWL